MKWIYVTYTKNGNKCKIMGKGGDRGVNVAHSSLLTYTISLFIVI